MAGFDKIEKTKTVGIFIPQIHRNGRHNSLEELCSELAKHGYKTLCFSSYIDFYHTDKNAEGEYSTISLGLRTPLSAMLVYGELIRNDRISAEICDRGLRRGIPVFTLDFEHKGAINLRYDYGRTFGHIVDHVIEVHGTKKLRMMSGVRGNVFSEERNEAFRRSLLAHGLEYSDELIYYGDFWSGPTIRELKRLLEDCGGELPDAIICANDMMAITVCTELAKIGIKVPDDIIVTGFDGLDQAINNLPSITTAQPDHSAACEFLIDVLCEAEKSGIKPLPQTKTFGFKMLLGNSCGCRENTSIAGVINAELNEKIVRELVFRMSMDKMVMNCVDGRGIISALEASERYIAGVTYRCLEIYLDPTYFGSPRGLTCRKVLAARTMPDTNEYSVPFTEADIDELCSDVMLMDSETILFVPIHKQEQVYGYAAARYSCSDIESGERLYDLIAHLNMMFSSIESATKLSEMVKKLDNMHIRDPLTDLLNRRGFRRELPSLAARAKERDSQIAVISVDMDGLKIINDTYGHSEGDFAIASLAHILEKLTDNNGVCARFGGDEYIAAVVVERGRLPDYSARLQELLTEFNASSGKPYDVHASIGVEISEPSALCDSIEEYIKLADDKMYRQKNLSKLSRGFKIKT